MNPGRQRSGVHTLGIALVLAVLALALIEMALQIFHLASLVAGDPDNFISREQLARVSVSRKVDDPVLGHRPNPAFFEHDAKGFRNAAVPATGQVDIVALGDSQTYGTSVHRAEAWPQQLQRLTGRTVYSMAFGGYSPAHYLLLLDEALALKPRLVITAVYFGNDLLEAFLLGYQEQHRQRFASKNTERFNQLLRLEQESPVTTEVNRIAQDPELFLPYINNSPGGWLSRNLRIVDFGVRLKNRLMGQGHPASSCLEGPPSGSAPAGGAPTVLTPQYRLLTLDQRDIRVQEGLRITQEALAVLDEQLKHAGVNHLVVFIPTKERVYEELVLKTSSNEAFRRLVENETLADNMLANFLQEKGIPHFSLLPALKESLWEGKVPYRNSNDGHPSPKGQRAIAQCIADYFETGN